MRIVFMGSPRFAADILEELATQHDIVCAYTMPDRVRSRGKRTEPTPVKATAERLGIPVRMPSTLRDPAEVSSLAALEPEVICVAAYGMILPQDVLDIPPAGCLNVHASLLPRWRGAAPIERAVLAGDEQVGVCIMRMEAGLDTGDFCVRRSIPAAGKTASQLTDELALLGASALLAALAHIEEDSVVWTSQDEAAVTYADKIAKGELDMAPDLLVADNVRRVLASGPAHPSRFSIDDDEFAVMKVRAVEAAEDSVPLDSVAADIPGAVARTKKRLFLRAQDGWIEVLELKPSGRKEMPTPSFLAGAHLSSEPRWDRVGA